MRVLIAHFDMVSRATLEKFFSSRGHEVIVAEDGARALHSLEQLDAPRLALLDWKMPQMDGVQVCRAVRELGRESCVYIVLLATEAQKKDIERGLEAGADDVLIRPFDMTDLKARLAAGFRILQLEEELLTARQDLQFQALHDPLTGLPNRRVIMDSLRAELARAKRQKISVSIILVDLDNLRQINDTRGNQAGDAALREVGRRIQASIRAYDLVGRYGGEEFLVVLPACDVSGALRQAERLRAFIAQQPVDTPQGTIPVTVSLGVTAAAALSSADPNPLLTAADQALCRAKEKGRNCVELATTAEGQA